MRYLPFYLLFSLLFSPNLYAQSQDFKWEWADGFGSPEQNDLDFMEVDDAGNVYLLGRFKGDFKRQNYRDLTFQEDQSTFLAKYSPSGERLWLKDLNNHTALTVNGLRVDHLGNCFVIGFFKDQYVYFMGEQLRNVGGVEEFEDSFIAKISGDGELLWSTQMGIIQDDRMTQLVLDGMGNAYALMLGTSYRKRTTDEGPQLFDNNKIEEGTTKGIKFTLNGGNRRRAKSILKFSSEGEVLWASEIALVTYNSTTVIDFEADFEGNLYLTGRYQGDIFGDLAYMEIGKIRNLLPRGEAYTYLMKMDMDGHFLWADQFPSTLIEVDEVGNIFSLGGLWGDFINDRVDIGSDFVESIEGENLVLLQYDSDGNYSSYTTFGSTNDDSRLFSRNTSYVTIKESAFAFHSFNNTVKFDYGKDGNLYLFREFIGELIFGNHRIMKDGLFLIRFNSDGEVTKVVERVNDDIGIDTQNPFIRTINDPQNKERISHMGIDATGKILLGGQQFGADLNLGGRRIHNQDFVRNIPSIWLGKLAIE